MTLRCCKCGQQSSSSSSRSASSGSGSGGSGSASASSMSASASSVSDGYPTVPCLYCKDFIGPSGFEMEWALANNCPYDPGLAVVGCYDQALGPHYGITASDQVEIGSFRCPDPGYVGCFWEKSTTGEVTITRDLYGTCGTCSPGPRIVVIVGGDRTDGAPGSYYIYCFVYFYYGCTHIIDPGPPAVGIGEAGYVFLMYSKTSSLPLNCMGENELTLVCADGFDEFSNSPIGGPDLNGIGPGCNTVNENFGNTFPATIILRPDTGGGLFP